MKTLTVILVGVAISTASSLGHAATPIEQRIAVAEGTDTFQLSLPASQIVMTIPRGSFKVVHEPGVDATANPTYFHLVDSAAGVVISGWFEPAQAYTGLEALWKSETDAWKKHRMPQPKNSSFKNIDKWEVVLYDLKVPGGSNTHIRGELVELNTWIDVHISATTTESADVARATALSVLKSIQIAEAP